MMLRNCLGIVFSVGLFLSVSIANIKAAKIPVVNNLESPIMVNIIPADPDGAQKFLMDPFYIAAGLYLPIIQPGTGAFVGTLEGYEIYNVYTYDPRSGNMLLSGHIHGPLVNIKKLFVYQQEGVVKISIKAISGSARKAIKELAHRVHQAKREEDAQIDMGQKLQNKSPEFTMIGKELVPIYDASSSGESPLPTDGTMVGKELVPFYDVSSDRANPLPADQKEKVYAQLKGAVFSKPFGVNEDRWVIDESNPRYAVYGIFDGHGGSQAAQYCADTMSLKIIDKLASGKHEEQALQESFVEVDHALCNSPIKACATAVVVLVDKLHKVLYMVNAYDSRAIFIKKDLIIDLSNGRKVTYLSEIQRTKSAGVLIGDKSCGLDPFPINVKAQGKDRISDKAMLGLLGVLPVKKAVSCRDLKAAPVAATHAGTEGGVVVLASDGIWDILNNIEVTNIVKRVFWPSPDRIAKKLVKKAATKGSQDDATALVVKIQ